MWRRTQDSVLHQVQQTEKAHGEEQRWRQVASKAERRRGRGRGMRGSVLCTSFVDSSGPRSAPSLWVLAGDYILGSGQRDGGPGASSPAGPRHRHHPAPTRDERNRTNTTKEKVLRPSLVEKLRCNLRRKIKYKFMSSMAVSYKQRREELVRKHTPPSFSRFLLVHIVPAWRGRGRSQRPGRPTGSGRIRQAGVNGSG